MDALEQYIHHHTSPEEELLHELDRETNLRVVQPRMLSGHIQGRLLEMLVRMLRPRRILEIGTFTGYSALSMAAGLEEGGELHTIEVEDEETLAMNDMTVYYESVPDDADEETTVGMSYLDAVTYFEENGFDEPDPADYGVWVPGVPVLILSLIHISEPPRP